MNVLQAAQLELEDLLPHRGKMLLIQEVLSVDSEQASTANKVRKSWPLASDDGVDSLVLIELAAQTAGVCNGWDRIHSVGMDSDKMGWLVGIKNADITIDLLPYGVTLTASAKNTLVFENFRESSCEIFLEDQQVASITLQLFQA